MSGGVHALNQRADRLERRAFFGWADAGPGRQGLVGLHPSAGRCGSRRPRRRRSDCTRWPVFVSPRSTWPKSSCTSKASLRCNTSRSKSPNHNRTALPTLASGAVDIGMAFAPPIHHPGQTWGSPIGHAGGCPRGPAFELFGTERVYAIRDLKGKTVADPEQGGVHYLFLASMASMWGCDPRKDINWVLHPRRRVEATPGRGKDRRAGWFFRPCPRSYVPENRARSGQQRGGPSPVVAVFCCIVTGNREFVRKHPVATKRAAACHF